MRFRRSNPVTGALWMFGLCCGIIVLMAFPVHAQPQSTQVATIKVTKSIPTITLDDRVTFLLTIENNGSYPVFDLEVFEYLNQKLQPQGNAVITAPFGKSEFPMASAGVGSAAQVIIDPPPPNTLLPGQTMTIEYKQLAPSSGDFQVPAALTWYSYKLGSSTIRLNFYSNGLILHIPNGYEKTVLIIYPYVLSITAFAITLTILFWARNRLGKINRAKQF